ncbi:hypothetical protein F6X51_04325 [Methylobacterium planeticum]|uniref:Uncharacterized protein n=2 Tax=Methylobacterium planeticum TaxID=2615211 RepID=A0A6N6MUL8_9HYPH|nr:hypothetical protein F6X51_04325 [Methylobacterium planeticum]
MIFALGFLAASLVALLILPAVNKRAARLARRRVEAMFPLSYTEIAAEKDFLRAQFAVQQRRLERKVEATLAKRHADLAEIGARSMEIAALARDVETRDGTLAERARETAFVQATLVRVEDELGVAREEGVAGLATLRALEEAHGDMLETLVTTRRERDAARLSVSATEPVALSAQHASLVAEREALRASLAAAEDALAQALTNRGEDLHRENAELRHRITEVADALTRRERLPAVDAYALQARN